MPHTRVAGPGLRKSRDGNWTVRNVKFQSAKRGLHHRGYSGSGIKMESNGSIAIDHFSRRRGRNKVLDDAKTSQDGSLHFRQKSRGRLSVTNWGRNLDHTEIKSGVMDISDTSIDRSVDSNKTSRSRSLDFGNAGRSENVPAVQSVVPGRSSRSRSVESMDTVGSRDTNSGKANRSRSVDSIATSRSRSLDSIDTIGSGQYASDYAEIEFSKDSDKNTVESPPSGMTNSETTGNTETIAKADKESAKTGRFKNMFSRKFSGQKNPKSNKTSGTKTSKQGTAEPTVTSREGTVESSKTSRQGTVPSTKTSRHGTVESAMTSRQGTVESAMTSGARNADSGMIGGNKNMRSFETSVHRIVVFDKSEERTHVDRRGYTLVGYSSHPLGRQGGIHVIKVHTTAGASPRMGFSIRGGSEFGLGVFVSQLEPRSPAEASGLRIGDQILEANGVDLENATSARAAELLGITLSPTLIVRRTRKVPEWKVTKERILWYDVPTKKLVVIPSGEVTSVKHPGAQRTVVTERRVVLKLVRKTDFIGINVRGGKEYGLGIYVSRVDKGGVAEQAGIQVGDQLVQVNGRHLDDVTHPTAVELLRASKQLVITAWVVGRFPAYKELFSEYVWSDSDDRRGDNRVHTAELHVEPLAAPRRQGGGKQVTHRTRTKETRVDRASRSRSSRYDSGIVLNGIDSLHIGDDPAIDYDDDPEDEDYDHLQILRPELFFPRDQDIIFRGNYSENWRQLDKQYGEGSPNGSSTARDRRSTHNYRPKPVKAAALNSDSDSSDLEMDYTTFLERKMRRDEGRLTTSSVISSEGNVDGGERRNPGARVVQGQSSKVTAEFSVNDGVGHSEDVYSVVHKPPRSGQRLNSAKTGQSSVYTVSHTTGESKQGLDFQSGDAYEASPHTHRHSENPAPVPRATDQRKDTYAVMRDTYTVSDRTVSSEQRQDSRAVRPDVYAVVLPHTTQGKDSEARVTMVGKVGDGSATKHAMEERFAKGGKGGGSTSDYYSHSANDNNSNTSRSSGSDQGADGIGKAHRSHRTYVYHINGSSVDDVESESVKVVRPQLPYPPSTFRGNNTISDHYEGGSRGFHTTTTTTTNHSDDKLDDDYTVVAEVLDEMTTSFGAANHGTGKLASPRHHYSPPEISLMPGEEEDGEGSSASSRSVTPPITPVTLTSVRPGGEQTTLQLLSAEIRRLEERQSNLGSREIFNIAGPTEQAAPFREDKKAEPEPEKKVGAWTHIKKKLTGSFRVKKGKKADTASSPESFSVGSVRKKGVFERTFGSQMMSQHTVDKYNMMMVEERARQLLNKDECIAVLKHIKTYHDNKQLDRLVELLLTILDRPEKLQLLKDIRGVIYPYHVGRFDSLVASHEVTSYERMSTKLHLPLSPVHRQDSGSKPRTKLMTTVLDTDGHFHIKSVDQHDYDTQLQSQVVSTLQQSKSKSFDTSPAINTITTSNSVYTTTTNNNNTYTSSNTIYSNSGNTFYTSSSNNNNEKRKKSDVTSPVHVVPPPIEWRDDIKVIIVEKEPPPPPPPPPPQPVVEEGIAVYVSKQKKNLGLIVCGGAGDHMDPSVRIDLVMPWGAAADDDRIQAGMHILSVDGQSVKGMTQSEAIAVLKRCFHDTRSVNMKLVVKHP